MKRSKSLAQLLINVKVTDAACRRDHKSMVEQHGTYENLSEAVHELYEFLRSKSISDIEVLTIRVKKGKTK